MRLTAPESDGVQVTKIYTFQRGKYLIDVSFEVSNQRSAPIQPFSYFQMLRDSQPPVGSFFMVPTYTGAAMYTEQKNSRRSNFQLWIKVTRATRKPPIMAG